MYETIFSLSQRPFLAAPRTDRYFAAAAIENARQTLARGIERAEGPGLLIGPAGSGKSLICQLLAEQFAEQFSVVQLSSARLCTPRALLQNILFELGLPFRDLEEGELRLNLIDFLQRSDRCPNGMLLLVDEANTLPLRLLEEIRMITNVVRDGIPRVRLVLAGGTQLEERFASPRLESLNQRIAARCYLQSMTREETAQYVRHQIGQAGGDAQALFGEDALRAVFDATDGVPRLVNQVCDHALMLAAAAGQPSLSPASIEEAWAELQQLPAPSLAVNQDANPQDSASEVVEFGQLDDDVDSVEDQEISLSEEELMSLAPDPSNESTSDADDKSDPFGHEFEEEEVVLDRYASLDSSLLETPPANVHVEELEAVADAEPDAEPPQPESAVEAPSQEDLVAQHEESEAPPAPRCESSESRAEIASTVEFQPTVAGPASDDQLEYHFEAEEDPAELAEPELPAAAEPAGNDGTEENEAPEIEPTIHSIDDAPAVEAVVPDDDRDMIIVEEDAAQDDKLAEPVAARVRRREYRHLFAKLRSS